MPDSFDADEIARKSFESGRKGYEPQEVRAYLHEVSSFVDRLQREHRDLKERAERAEARLGLSEKPDEAMLLEVLGEETTRVLTSAREAAVEIKSKAEAAAERIVAEATSEAAETRSGAVQDADRKRAEATAESEALLGQARGELDRRSAEAEAVATRIRDEAAEAAQSARDAGQAELTQAEADAEGIREAAHDEGRTMVAEAQAVRERILKDLAGRRKKARKQVEKLNAGRERLLEAYDVVRSTVDEATTELHQSLADARLAAEEAARRVEDEDDLTIEELDAEVSTAALVIDLAPTDVPVEEGADDEGEAEEVDDSPGPLSGEVPAITADTTAPDEATNGPVDLDERRSRKQRRRSKPDFAGVDPEALVKVEPPTMPDEGIRILAEPASEPSAVADDAEEPADEPAAADEPEADAPAAVDEPEPDAPAAVDEAPAPAESEAAAEEPGAPSVGDLFARLRSETSGGETDVAEPVADPEVEPESEPDAVENEPAAEVEPEPDAAPDAAALPFRDRDDALAPLERELGKRLKRALADEQNDVLDQLRRSKPQGVDDLLPSADDHAARWAETVTESLAAAAAAGAGDGKPTSTADVADELARSLTGPLRDRIDRSFAAADGNLDDVADRVRALYREWKGQRLQDAASHFLTAAYARGRLDALAPGTSVQWVLDPDHPACPDCSDNVLAGAVTKGDEFPTGQTNAPAHPGCRCLVLAAGE